MDQTDVASARTIMDWGSPRVGGQPQPLLRAPLGTSRARGPCAEITHAQARAALADPALRRLAAARRVDLHAILRALALAPAERLAAAPVVSTADFWSILATLRSHEVRFVLIGGIAARLHGSTFGTADFDICHARDIANLCALATMLRGLDAIYRRLPVHGPPELDARIFATETDFVFCTRHGKFDLIGEFTGVGRYAEASADAVPVLLGERTARVLSLRKIRASKRSTGRAKDQLVADELDVVDAVRARLAESE